MTNWRHISFWFVKSYFYNYFFGYVNTGAPGKPGQKGNKGDSEPGIQGPPGVPGIVWA